MYLIIVFLCGIANFTMHKAVLECGHPFVEDTKHYFGGYLGGKAGYFLEFLALAGALIFAHRGSGLATLFYGSYTAMSGFAAWMLINRRI